jgi:hypothetical protein
MKKKFYIFIILLLIVLIPDVHGQRIQSNNCPKTISTTNKINTLNVYDTIDINQIVMWVGNNGSGSNSPDNRWGFIWPKWSGKGAIFQDGPLIGGKINNKVYLGGSMYRQSLQAGKIINGQPDDSLNSKYRIYKIQKDWSTSIDAKRLKNDYDNWPGDDGAPYIDKNGNGRWDKGIDEPKFIGDQQLWYVMNDMDSNKTKYFSGTKPMGLEIQCLVFGYDLKTSLKNVVFKKYTIINKGESDIDSVCFGYWSDPDLGFAADDRSGCDTTLNLAFCYNGVQIDKIYGTQCPAVGYDIIQGPIVIGSSGDMANWNFGKRKGFKNLGMTSFIPFVCGAPEVLYCPGEGDYAGAVQWFNLMKGATKNDSVITNPITNLPTKFIFEGDPVTGIGWLDGDGRPKWNTFGPGDRYHLQSSGPFKMIKGDTQEVIIAIVIGQGTDRLSSITAMRNTDLLAKELFKNPILIDSFEYTFIAAKNGDSPTPQNLIIKSSLGQLSGWTISDKPTWLNVSKSTGTGEDTIQFSISTTNLNEGTYTGKITLNSTGSISGKQEINIKYIIEPNPPKIKLSTNNIIFGTVKNIIRPSAKKVYINNTGGGSLKWSVNNSASWLDIIPSSGSGGDSMSIGVNTTNLTPGEYNTRIYINANAINNPETIDVKYTIDPIIFGDTIKVEKIGNNDGVVYPIVVDKSKLNGHSYEISFDTTNDGTHAVTLWKVMDILTRELKATCTNFSGYGEYPLFDGIYLKVIGPSKIGLRTDDDPIQRGWTWEPGPPLGSNRFLSPQTWIGFGLQCFGPVLFGSGYDNSIGYPAGSSWYNGTTILPNDLKKVEIRFSSDKTKWQKAYRYVRGANVTAYDPAYVTFIINKVNYGYQDYVDFPGTVWNIDATPAQQLAIGFMENNAAKPVGSVDGMWRPTTDVDGGREFLFIFASPYTTTAISKYQGNMLNGPTIDLMYLGIFKDRGLPFPQDAGANVEATLTLIPYRSISISDKFTFSSQSLVSINDKKDKIEALRYALYQNYPNPFNPSTIIKYEIPENAFVTIRIYNSIGQEIENLIDQKQNMGRYEVSWKPKNLSSGIYFNKLEVSGLNPLETKRYNEYRKMLYIK